MTQFTRALLFWTLILSACAPILPPTETIPDHAPPATEPPGDVSVPPTEAIPDSPALPIPRLSRTIDPPNDTPQPDDLATPVPSYPQGCGYQWAYKDMPELSASFLQSVQVLQLEAQAYAYGFGEDCVHADMSRTFIPMETDFNVLLQVSDLQDEAVLGEWVVKIMQIIESIPPEQIIGPRPGRVGIMFESNGQRAGVGFYIDQYQALAPGLSNAEIYLALQALP